MLAIRLQRVGRKGYAQYRMIVQDSRFSPKSGRVVAQLGHYNPHTKDIKVDKELANSYLAHGAQPSERVVQLLQAQDVTLPAWVDTSKGTKQRSIKKPEKLRKHQPAEPVAEAEPEAESAAEPEATNDEAGPDTEAPADNESAAETTAEPEAADKDS